MPADDQGEFSVPRRPSEPAKPRGGPLALILAGMLALVVFAGLFVLLAQIAVALVAGFVLILLAAAFHYLVWGRWIGESIRREVEAEDEQSRADADRP